MKCPFCSRPDNRVVDSRLSREGVAIRRRRECDACHRRFTTYERVEEIHLMVVKKDGRREPFDRQKILSGLQTACQKRPVSTGTLEEVVDRIERKVLEAGEREVPTRLVGEEVVRALHRLDPVAYVRFASVYRAFKDVNEFRKTVEDLSGKDEDLGGKNRA